MEPGRQCTPRIRSGPSAGNGMARKGGKATKMQYDGAGSVKAIRDLRDPVDADEYTGSKNGVHDRLLEYDALYRLVKATYQDSAGLRREMRYAYNAIGNLTERSTTDAAGVVNGAEEFYEKWLGPMGYALERPHAFAEAGAEGAPQRSE